MDEKKRDALRRIAELLNGRGVVWAVGGSLLLYFYGLTDTFHDIDLLVARRDADAADAALSAIGQKEVRAPTPLYESERFYEYTIGGVEADVICGFVVCNLGARYCFSLDESGVAERRTWEGLELPLGRLEDWYVFYQMMPDREAKVCMAEEGLKARGAVERSRFALAAKNGVPAVVRARIEKAFGPIPPL